MKICFIKSLPVIFLAVLTVSCSTSMRISDQLQTDSTVLEVKGRRGGMPSNKLVFGEYSTGKVERKFASVDEKAFAVSSQTLRDTMQFEVTDTFGHSAKVFCMNKASQLNVPVSSDQYQTTIGSQNVCFGTITLAENAPVWEFTLKNPNTIAQQILPRGIISNGETTITIRQVQQNERGQTLNDIVLGFEFWKDNEVIGAVELIGSGRIMLKNSLPKDVKLILASTAATLLLRYDINKAKEM